MPVVVRREGSPRAKLGAAWARRAGERVLAALRLSEVELSVVLVDDRTMRTLNRSHRGDDHATDVLSFPLWEGEDAGLAESGGLLGDVVLAVDVCAKQARARGIRLEDEAAMLLCHGVLHLLGLDHRDRTEERRMTARTDALRSTLVAARAQVGRGPKRISPRGRK